MVRRKIREAVLKALYATELSNEKLEKVIELTLRPEITAISKEINFDNTGEELSQDEVIRFAEKLYLRTLNKEQELDGEIQRHIENWDINRLAVIDKITLRMAICEFLEFPEIPVKVSINEAIEIVKKYSTEKSGKFVNGILDSICQTLRREGRLKKSGRGLIGETIDRDKLS